MYKGKKILAIIPARGGSKGLPDKNILPLLGRPLISWTIEQARKSSLLDSVVVSTDSPKIAEVAKEYGAEVPFLRPKRLAGDNSPTIDAIEHCINSLERKGRRYDLIALLEPTSPLRKDSDIDNAIKALVDSKQKATSLVSVGKVSLEHPAIMKRIKDGYARPYQRARKVWQRQQLDEAFFPYGVIYLSYTNQLLKRRTFYQSRTLPYFIARWQNYEIDDMCDFICVEAILKSIMSGVIKE